MRTDASGVRSPVILTVSHGRTRCNRKRSKCGACAAIPHICKRRRKINWKPHAAFARCALLTSFVARARAKTRADAAYSSTGCAARSCGAIRAASSRHHSEGPVYRRIPRSSASAPSRQGCARGTKRRSPRARHPECAFDHRSARRGACAPAFKDGQRSCSSAAYAASGHTHARKRRPGASAHTYV